ncbi:hypothetical protein Y032_0017g3329 [Ancylostoma ceylanicum]|uniref:Uncharacterized protein n=1 Tax=Ancylostoma ceylanicum TaxID=53326 RepID=A0A016V4M3_9BILA|nr:hypothetical protein Y032_0017g3329 [Ancylostoma ceylanicum]
MRLTCVDAVDIFLCYFGRFWATFSTCENTQGQNNNKSLHSGNHMDVLDGNKILESLDISGCETRKIGRVTVNTLVGTIISSF